MSISWPRSVLAQWLGDLSGALSSILFPAGCRICDQLLPAARRLPLCEHCLSSFEPVPRGSCDLCGLPETFNPEFSEAISFCRDCQERRFAFELARTHWFGRFCCSSTNGSNRWECGLRSA